MRTFKNAFKVASVFGVVLWLSSLTGIFAQEENSTATDSTTTETVAAKDWKQEIVSDKQQTEEQKEDIINDSQTARGEEKNLRDQIRQAEQSGDSEQAKSLRSQLETMHQENLQQKQQDLQGLKDARQELRSDSKEVMKEKLDVNKDGQVDEVEKRAYDKTRADANHDGTVDQTEKEAFQDRVDKKDEGQPPQGQGIRQGPGPRPQGGRPKR